MEIRIFYIYWVVCKFLIFYFDFELEVEFYVIEYIIESRKVINIYLFVCDDGDKILRKISN